MDLLMERDKRPVRFSSKRIDTRHTFFTRVRIRPVARSKDSGISMRCWSTTAWKPRSEKMSMNIAIARESSNTGVSVFTWAWPEMACERMIGRNLS